MKSGPPLEDSASLFTRPWVTYPHDGDTVILVPENPMWARVNALGTELIGQCASGKTIGEVLADLPSQWRDHPERMEAGREMLQQLLDMGILSHERTKNIPYTGKRFSDVPELLNRVAVHVNRVDPASLSTAMSAIDQAGHLGCREIALCLDDEVSAQDQKYLIHSIVDRGMAVRVVAGYADVRPAADMLVGKEAVVVVNVDGASDSLNDRLRRRGALASSLSNLEKCLSVGVRAEVVTHVCADNLDSLPEIRRLVKREKAMRHLVSWQKVEGGTSHHPRHPADARATAAVFRAMESGELGTDIGADTKRLNQRLFFGAGVKLDLCDGALGSLAIGREGGVYPCSWCARTNTLRLGDMVSESLENIWLESVNAAVIRQNSIQRSPRCYLCSAKYLCGGFVACVVGCAHLSEGEYRESRDIDQFCETFRNFAVERLLALSAKLAKKAGIADRPAVVSHMRPSPSSSPARPTYCGSGDDTIRTFAASIGY